MVKAVKKIKTEKVKEEKVKKVKKVKKDKTVKPANILSGAYSDLLFNIDKKFELSTGDFSPLKLSTGVLSIDYICAGGLVPGMTTISGFEASGKSTLTMETLGCGLDEDIPLLRVDDAEGTFDGNYTTNVIRRDFGALLPKIIKGKLINNPRVWYSLNNEIEVYYNSLVQTFNRIPDKRFSKDAKGWFYAVSKNDKHHSAFIAALKDQKADATLSRGDKLYYPASNTAPQGIFFLDSYASMVTHQMVEKEEVNGMPTGPAIAFAKNIPRITGFLKRKGIIIFGVNQMRERPGMAFGNPQYETAGNALKLFSNCRLLISARATHKDWKRNDAKTTQWHEEPSVEYKGKIDQYAYKHIRNLKLKHGTPYLDCWARIWIKDGQKPGQGRGYDKAFDVYEYMRLNDMAVMEKSGGRIYIKFGEIGEKNSHPLSKRTIVWHDFKVLVLSEVILNKTDYFNECLKKTMSDLKLKEPPKIRQFCQKHLRAQTSEK